MKNNLDASVVAEVGNYDSYLTADASKTNEEDDYMNISEKEDQNTVVCQETFKIDVENIDKPVRQYGYQYMKLSMLRFSKKRKFYTSFLYLCKNNPNQPQFIPSDVKTVLKILATEQGLYVKVVMIC